MSLASKYAAMMAAGRKVKPPDFGLPGEIGWTATLDDNGQLVITSRPTIMSAEEARRFARWLLDVFGEEPS